MTEKSLKGYKVVTKELKSINCFDDKAGCRQYYVGKWIETSLINRGALCVFNDFVYVNQYIKTLKRRHKTFKIFDCLYVEALVDEHDNRYNDFIKHPLFVRQGKIILFSNTFHPGTKLAKKVKLIKEVEGI